MSKAYKQAIAALMGTPEIDFRALAIKLAQQSPTTFNQLLEEVRREDAAARQAHPQPGNSRLLFDALPQYEKQAYRTMVDFLRYHNRKVDAIKELRQLRGFGLKESKDVIDHLCNRLADDGYSVAMPSELYPLTGAQADALNMLIEAYEY